MSEDWTRADISDEPYETEAAGELAPRSVSERFWATIYVLKDKRIDWKMRVLPLVALVYLISPIDLIPDVFLPLFGLGIGDDLGVIALTIWQLQQAIGPEHVQKARAKIAQRSARNSAAHSAHDQDYHS
ncbi:MAG: hypothetical protein Alpg2KO_10070 [Alphaproteobacteria bacterium]